MSWIDFIPLTVLIAAFVAIIILGKKLLKYIDEKLENEL